jgi:ADP-heptose:LPS heptosyltransferase
LTRYAAKLLFDKKAENKVSRPIKHILLINWHGKIGDAVVSSFIYREIRKLGDVKISVITTPQLQSLYLEYYGADYVYLVKKIASYAILRRMAKWLDDVDTVIPLIGEMGAKELFLISRIKPANVFSIDPKLSYSCLRQELPLPPLRVYELYEFFLKKMGVENIDNSYDVPVKGKNLRPDYDILFNPFGSRPDKSLSVEKSISVLNKINYEFKDIIIGIIYSPETKSIAHEITDKCKNKSIQIVENIETIHDVIPYIYRSQVIISVDTSIVHISSGMNKNLIALYCHKENHFDEWLPRENKKTKIIFSRPKQESKIKNMNLFDDQEVLKNLNELLNIVNLI